MLGFLEEEVEETEEFRTMMSETMVEKYNEDKEVYLKKGE